MLATVSVKDVFLLFGKFTSSKIKQNVIKLFKNDKLEFNMYKIVQQISMCLFFCQILFI